MKYILLFIPFLSFAQTKILRDTTGTAYFLCDTARIIVYEFKQDDSMKYIVFNYMIEKNRGGTRRGYVKFPYNKQWLWSTQEQRVQFAYDYTLEKISK